MNFLPVSGAFRNDECSFSFDERAKPLADGSFKFTLKGLPPKWTQARVRSLLVSSLAPAFTVESLLRGKTDKYKWSAVAVIKASASSSA